MEVLRFAFNQDTIRSHYRIRNKPSGINGSIARGGDRFHCKCNWVSWIDAETTIKWGVAKW